jgi:hypothetical protein
MFKPQNFSGPTKPDDLILKDICKINPTDAVPQSPGIEFCKYNPDQPSQPAPARQRLFTPQMSSFYMDSIWSGARTPREIPHETEDDKMIINNMFETYYEWYEIIDPIFPQGNDNKDLQACIDYIRLKAIVIAYSILEIYNSEKPPHEVEPEFLPQEFDGDKFIDLVFFYLKKDAAFIGSDSYLSYIKQIEESDVYKFATGNIKIEDLPPEAYGGDNESHGPALEGVDVAVGGSTRRRRRSHRVKTIKKSKKRSTLRRSRRSSKARKSRNTRRRYLI